MGIQKRASKNLSICTNERSISLKEKNPSDQPDEPNTAHNSATSSQKPHIISQTKRRQSSTSVLKYSDGSQYIGKVCEGRFRHGKGVYVLKNGDKIEGEWKKDRLHGFGTRIYAMTGDRHEGMYYKHFRHGIGTYVWSNGDKYVGNWRLGKMSGKGSFFWSNGDIFEGQWKDGMMHGKGKKILASGHQVDAEWKRNVACGWGRKTFSWGDVYEGQFVNDLYSGYGSYSWVNGDRYEGNWLKGYMHGRGLLTLCNGDIIHGVWRNGYLFCQGVKRYSCGTTYHGEFNQDQEREGYGILTFSSGEVYEGEWKANSINGFGSWSSTDGRSFIGIWNNGIPCGNGIYTMTPDQTQPCTGTFKMGVLEPCGSFVIERLEIPM